MSNLTKPFLTKTAKEKAEEAKAKEAKDKQEKKLTKIKEFEKDLQEWDSSDNIAIQIETKNSDKTSPIFFICENIIIIQLTRRIVVCPLENFSKGNENKYPCAERSTDDDINLVRIDEKEKIIYYSCKTKFYSYKIKIDQTNSITLTPNKPYQFNNYITTFCVCNKILIFFIEGSEDICFIDSEKNSEKNTEKRSIFPDKSYEIDRIILYSKLLIFTNTSGSLMFLPINGPAIEKCSDLKKLKFGQLNTMIKYSENISMLEVSKEKSLMVIVAGGKGIDLWNLKMKKLDSSLIGHTDNVTAICFSNDGEKIISADQKHNVIIWNTVDCTRAAKILLGLNDITQIIVTQNNKHFFSASKDKKIYICDLENYTQEVYLSGHKNEVSYIRFHEGKIFSISKDNTLIKWNLADQSESKTYSLENTSFKNVIAFGEKILALTENSILLLSYSKVNGIVELAQNTELVFGKKLKFMRSLKNCENLIFAIEIEEEKEKKTDLIIIKNDNFIKEYIQGLELKSADVLKISSEDIIIVEPLENNFIFCIYNDFQYNLHNLETTYFEDGKIVGKSTENICYDIITFDYETQSGQRTSSKEKITKIILNTSENILTLIEIRYSIQPSVNSEEIEINYSETASTSTTTNKRPLIKNLQFLNQNYFAVLEEGGRTISVYPLNPSTSCIITVSPKPSKEITKMKKVTIKNKEKLEDYLVTISSDNCLRVWKIEYNSSDQDTQITIIEHFTIYEHTRPIIDIIHLPNTFYIATASQDGRVILWNINEKRIENVYRSHYSKLLGLAIVKKDETNNSILCYSEKMIEVWDYEDYKSQEKIKVKGAHNCLEKYIALTKLKYDIPININQRFICFGNEEFTFLHYYCYKNLCQLAEVAIKYNSNIRLSVNTDAKF